MAWTLEGLKTSLGSIFDANTQPLDMSTLNQFNYNALMNEYNSLGEQLTKGMSLGQDVTSINNQMNNISTQLTNLESLAAMQGTTVDKMTPIQAMQAQQMLEANTGITGFVNNNFGGWGNVMNGIGQLGNLFMNWRSLGLAEDQLALQQDAFNFNKAVTQTNLANQAKLTNARNKDILQSRAHTETGNKNAYDDEIKRREVKGEI